MVKETESLSKSHTIIQKNRAHTHTYKSTAETENGHPCRVSRNANRAPEEQKSTSCYHTWFADWLENRQGHNNNPAHTLFQGGWWDILFDFVFKLETVLQSCIVCLVLHLVAKSGHERSWRRFNFSSAKKKQHVRNNEGIPTFERTLIPSPLCVFSNEETFFTFIRFIV